MPGDKKHHTEKFRSCVEKVVAKGESEDSAYAICTVGLQDAGEPIFEGAESRSAEELKLLGDLPGHEFHGNQHTEGGGGGSEDKGSGKNEGKNKDGKKLSQKEMLREDADRVKRGEAPVHKEALIALYRDYVKGGKPTLRENAEHEELRTLHLLGATGKVRFAMHDGREHLVIPVVALMEGVIHAVNAETPEFVPAATLAKAAASWNGRPVVLGHPTKNGRQCSANSPDVLESHGMGTIFNSRVEGKKLCLEAWIDKAKAGKLDAKMLERLLENKMEEISVGAFVVTDGVGGSHGGKSYKASWTETTGDHLAFLPGGRGACSIEMGCGAHRAATMRVCGDHLELLGDSLGHEFHGNQWTDGSGGGSKDQHEGRRKNDGYKGSSTPVEGDEVKVMGPVRGQGKKGYVSGGSSDGSFVYVKEKKTGESLGSFHVSDLKVLVGKDDPQTPITAEFLDILASKKYKDCPMCDGSGSKDGNPCEACEGEGRMRAAAGARHSASDVEMIQQVHDHAMALGAKCERSNYKLLEDTVKQPCGCKGEGHMTKEKKAETIAALVTDKYSGFKEGDESQLEVASDARLEEYRAAADGRKTEAEAKAKLEGDQRNTTARLKVAEEKLKTLEDRQPTEDEFLASPAGATLRTLVAEKKAEDREERDALIKTLKSIGANTEEELNAMDNVQLRTLAKYAKVEQPNYEGARRFPVQRDLANANEDFTPPDPYAEGLKALQAGSKAVN